MERLFHARVTEDTAAVNPNLAGRRISGMRRSIKLLSVVAACSIAAAHAQDCDPEEGSGGALVPYIEVAGFAGYRMGGNFDVDSLDTDADLDDHSSFALAFDIARDDYSQYELYYSSQDSQLGQDSPIGPVGVKVEYLQIGGTLAVSDRPVFTPYITAGLGVTRFSPDAPGTDDSSHFSFSLGGGLRFPLSQRFSLRLEARGHLTFVDTDTALFCASGAFGGVCALQGSGSTFIQYELLAGAAFAF
jgi:opacity protein-like surface antigen